MKFLPLFLFIPFFGFSQNHLFKYYDEAPVLKEGKLLPMAWAGGINTAQLNRADLDGDLKDEIIIMDKHSAAIHIFSFENGNYEYRPELLQYLPALNIDWVIFADYNCDRKNDVFNYGQSGVILYKNTSGEGTFASWEKVADPLMTTGFSGKINLLINPTDVPAIGDIDGDGDLDILSYNFSSGEDIRFHKNLALEKHGNCGQFDFEIADRTWGKFKECSCFEYAFHGEECEGGGHHHGRVAHVGGKSMTTYDYDADGDQDLLLGHEDCPNLIYLENTGDAANALFSAFLPEFPANAPVIMERYPAVQFIDVDFDDKQEMTVSVNIEDNLSFTSDFSHSLWLYQMATTTSTPDFELTATNFLQKEMLDLGEMSAPAFFDIDDDGDEDLLVAANGKEADGVFLGSVALLENTGTSFNPSFSLEDADFMDLSSLELHVPHLRFADFNGDGKTDLFYSGYSMDEAQIKSFIFYNRAEGQNPPDFDGDPSQVSMPLEIFENSEFFDEDGDGDPDLLVGKRNGSLHFYENTGNATFNLAENEYMGIGPNTSAGKINLFAEVTDLDNDGNADLVTADRQEASVYYNFLNAQGEPATLAFFSETTQSEMPILTENYNWLAFADLFGTGRPSMVAGGSGGGLKFFRNKDEIDNPGNISARVKVYPNPVKESSPLVVETNKAGTASFYNLWGQRVSAAVALKPGIKNQVGLPPLARGIYIMIFEAANKEKVVTKLVVR